MKAEAVRGPVSPSKWISTILFVVALYLMYSTTFLSDYLMNDEWAYIGSAWDASDLERLMRVNFYKLGRGLFGAYQWLIYTFVGYDPAKVQQIRFLNFASFVLMGVVLLRFLEARMRFRAMALFVMLVLFSQPVVQGLMGYGLQLIANVQPAMWLSLAAFYVFFFRWQRGHLGRVLRIVLALILLLLAFQSTQTYALFAAVPLTWLILTEWRERRAEIGWFLLLGVVALGVSSLVYKLGLTHWHALGKMGYDVGEAGISAVGASPLDVAVRALNPFSYWSSFKFWSFPFPFHNTLSLSLTDKQVAASVLLAGWLLLVLLVASMEWISAEGQARAQVAWKWLAVGVCFSFGAVFLVADSPLIGIDHRPHIALTLVGVVIFSAAYCLQELANRFAWLRHWAVVTVGIAWVMVCVFGAQAAVFRGLIQPRVAQMAFMRTALSAKPLAQYKQVIVVDPAWRECVFEPCDPWMGQVLGSEWSLTRRQAYRYALSTLGLDDPRAKRISFVEVVPETVPDNAVVVDWALYHQIHQAYASTFEP